MPPDSVTLSQYRGNTLSRNILLLQQDGITPFDITGCTVKFSISPSLTEAALITEETAGVTIAVNGPGGSITLAVPASIMSALKNASYLFDVQVTFADGTVQTLFLATLQLEDVLTV